MSSSVCFFHSIALFGKGVKQKFTKMLYGQGKNCPYTVKEIRRDFAHILPHCRQAKSNKNC